MYVHCFSVPCKNPWLSLPFAHVNSLTKTFTSVILNGKMAQGYLKFQTSHSCQIQLENTVDSKYTPTFVVLCEYVDLTILTLPWCLTAVK